MKTRIKIEMNECTKFVHVFMILLITAMSFKAMSQDYVKQRRHPASAPDEEVMTLPSFDKPFLLSVFAEDDSGVMSRTRSELRSWEETEQYAKTWHLESTGLYKTPSSEFKQRLLSKRLLDYADKRLNGEMKNAEEGSALHSVGQVEKSLRPNAEVGVSRQVSIQFKVRALQGRATMEIKNPWVECITTLNSNGRMTVLTKKDFKSLGLTSGVEYRTYESQWIAYTDKEITQNIRARISSTQNNQSILSNDAEKKLELNASFPLDL